MTWAALVHAGWRGVERMFTWLYTRGAWAYPAVAWVASAGRWQGWVEHMARQVPRDAAVLELGFGPGYAQAVWAARGQVAWGVDASWAMARRAAARVLAVGGTPRLTLAVAQALPFPAASVDVVFVTFPAAYIADPVTAREVVRVLRPGGRLWVLLEARGGLLRLWAALVAWALRRSGAPAAPAQVLAVTYAAAGLKPQVREETLPGGARGLVLRARKPGGYEE